jgi:hypothetical protein
MPKLEHLFPLFNEVSEEEQIQIIRNYRLKRNVDIDSFINSQKSKPNKMTFTDEEKVIMKLLGISPKTLGVLKSMEEPEEEEDDEEVSDE